jgi:hypothetical protein
MSKWLEAKKIKWKFYIDSSDFSNIVKEYSDKIDELEEENDKLKESLDIATKCSSKEEDWIIRLSEENKKLREFKAKQEEMMFLIWASIELAHPKTYRDAEKLQKGKELYEKLYKEELYYLKEENKKLKDENVDLKSELSKFRDSFKKYRDYEKEELAESCYDLERENESLRAEVKNLVERNIELDKKYTFVLSKLRR